MKAFLLAAGLGTRLHPITLKIPKCLVPVKGKPLMAYWLDLLFCSGLIDTVLINTHYLAEQVRQFIRTNSHREKVVLVHEEKLLGTAGSILENRVFFEEAPFLLIHADNYSIFDLGEFIDAHQKRPKGCELTMMSFETDTPESCGILELDRNGIVTAFHEKVKHPPGNTANGAVYIIEPSVINFMGKKRKGQMKDFSKDVLPHYIGRIFTHKNTQYHRDIGTIESLKKAETEAF